MFTLFNFYSQAHQLYTTALDSSLIHQLFAIEARCRINIGTLYETQGKYLQALEQLQQALDICKKNNYEVIWPVLILLLAM